MLRDLQELNEAAGRLEALAQRVERGSADEPAASLAPHRNALIRQAKQLLTENALVAAMSADCSAEDASVASIAWDAHFIRVTSSQRIEDCFAQGQAASAGTLAEQ